MSASEIIFSVHKSPDGGYEAQAIGYSIFTQAETMAELDANVKDAVARHFAETKTLPTIRTVKVLSHAIRFGSAKGEFTVPDNFNDPDPEIEDLFYNGPVFPE
jgi:hypothetical protein